ncbi:MAG: DEAD/DEAH box helicase [Bacteroidales bacterium]|nr:DEAD/DEAH box helicase [Bacteroidales bacterium]
MKTFEELGLLPSLLKAITEMGFESPMPVQEAVIPLLLEENNDVIALAQTGTGKTAAFGLPVIQKIELKNRYPQALILCPTRELCLQISDDLTNFSVNLPELKILAVYGGSSIELQMKALKKGVHIVVATPGRLIDLLNRKALDLQKVRNVVLDEADEMLNMGFSESIQEILSQVPQERNMLLFSATMPKEIAAITRKYMNQPKEIVIGKKNEGSSNVKHRYYLVHARDKYLALKRIADYYPNIYGIIFCRTRKETQEIADLLIQDGYNADSLHGELSQAQRDNVMQRFRIKNLQLLVATDVAARGLDVDNLTHVINYGLPDDVESYTHRSGRTGRAGKTGTSIAIIHTKEKGKLKEIERSINKTFEKGVIPSGKEICEKQLFGFVDKLERVEINEDEISALLPAVFRKLEWLEKEDIIKRMVSLEFNRFISYYYDAKEIEVVDERREKKERDFNKKRDDYRRGDDGFTRLFINLGKIDGMYPNSLIEFINNNVPGKVRIGKIDLMKTFSFFEVEGKSAKTVVKSLNNTDFYGRKVSLEFAQDKNYSEGRGNKKGNYRREEKDKRKKGR